MHTGKSKTGSRGRGSSRRGRGSNSRRWCSMFYLKHSPHYPPFVSCVPCHRTCVASCSCCCPVCPPRVCRAACELQAKENLDALRCALAPLKLQQYAEPLLKEGYNMQELRMMEGTVDAQVMDHFKEMGLKGLRLRKMQQLISSLHPGAAAALESKVHIIFETPKTLRVPPTPLCPLALCLPFPVC